MDLQKYEGDVYLGRIKNGVPRGLIGPIECDSFLSKREDGEEVTLKSKRRDIYNQTIYSETTPGNALLSMSFKDVPSNLFGLAFASEPEDLEYIAGTVTDEAVAVASAGTLYLLAKRNVKTTPAVVVTNVGGSTTYDLDDDYTIDARIGGIRIVAGGAIATALATAQGSDPDATISLEVSYSYNAFEGESFDGETVTEAEFAVFFDGKNRLSQKDISVEYYSVKLKAPADGMDLLSSELITVVLEGIASTPTGKTSPSKILRATA